MLTLEFSRLWGLGTCKECNVKLHAELLCTPKASFSRIPWRIWHLQGMFTQTISFGVVESNMDTGIQNAFLTGTFAQQQ